MSWIDSVVKLDNMLEAFAAIVETNTCSQYGVPTFTMLVDKVTFVSLNLYMNLQAGYLPAKSKKDGEALISMLLGFTVVSCLRS